MSHFMSRLNLYDVPYVAKFIQYTFYTKPIFALKKVFEILCCGRVQSTMMGAVIFGTK